MLKAARTEYFRKEFEQHKRNTKHLYKLVDKLTGCTSVNPLPEIDSDDQIAEDFPDYFLNKIVKIRDELDQYGKHVVESHHHVKELQAFHPLSETEVGMVIKKLQTKSCELDHIPTYIVKNHLDYFIQPYTHIVNLSLVIVSLWTPGNVQF